MTIRFSIGMIAAHEEVPLREVTVSPTERMELVLIDTLGYFSTDLVVVCGDEEIWNADDRSQDSFDLTPYEGRELMVYEKNSERYKTIKQLRKAYKYATDKMAQFFIKSPLIHVEVKINGKSVVGLIDTGSQITIITKQLAEQCGIYHRLDVRFKVDASGVGGVKQGIGKILDADFELPNQQLMPVVLTVFDEKPFGDSDLIIGVDVLTTYHANIDFKQKMIVFNGDLVLDLIQKE